MHAPVRMQKQEGLTKQLQPQSKRDGGKAPGPVPGNVEDHPFNPDRDKEIVEDQSQEKETTRILGDKPGTRERGPVKKHHPWLSAVAAYVDKLKILNHLLDTKVEMSIGKIFAVS